MTTVAPEQDPLLVSNMCGSTQISGHMSWGLDDPETTVSEEIHCFVKRSKFYPRSIELLPFLCLPDWIEVSPVPLHSLFGIVRYEMSRRAELRCLRAEESARCWKLRVDWTAMIPMCVTYLQVSQPIVPEHVLGLLPEQHRINIACPNLSLR